MVVTVEKKYNLLYLGDMSFLFSQWHDFIDDFNDDYVALVKLNGKFNFIKPNGEYLYHNWYDGLGHDFNYDDETYTIVTNNGKYNLIDIHEQLLTQQWYDKIEYFNNMLFKVCVNNKWNLMSFEGRLLSSLWFDKISFPSQGYVEVEVDGAINYLDYKTGKLLNRQYLSTE